MDDIDLGKNHGMGIWLLARDLATDIRVLYDLYFDYATSRQVDSVPYVVPDTFTIVCAFACVRPELRAVSGYVPFIGSSPRDRVRISLIPHHWLVWRGIFIIDLIPVDGKFGVSTPQLTIEQPAQKRFLQAGELFPESWDVEKKATFDTEVSRLVEILEMLMAKIPL